MKTSGWIFPFPLSLFFLLSFFLSLDYSYAAEGRKAMVATASPYATEAALEILQRGGNAVDAAVAAQWVLNVVEPQGSGIGGGAFFVYYDAPTKRVVTFDGREAAPGSAHPDMFQDASGKTYPYYPDRITGGLPVGVPGVLKLLKEVHGRYGSKNFDFAELFTPAVKLARRGFPVTERLARHIDQEKERLRRFEASGKIFLDTKGEALRQGAILFQPDLAGTFELVQKEGIDVFYRGAIAREIVRAVRQAPYHPGLLEPEDLAQYRVIERAPVKGWYRGYTVYSMGPPSSGGAALLETLNILENFDLRELDRGWKAQHVLAEAQAIAFEDRAAYLGDPAYSKIPLQKLLSKAYAKERAAEINFDFARLSEQAKRRGLAPEGMHTSHVSIADEHGNLVAFTTTIESVFGCGMVVPGRGFVLNNELTDFDATAREKSNVKREASSKNTSARSSRFTLHSSLHPNVPESDKRPRSSMTPTLVFRKGEPVLVAGSPGGSTIIGTVVNLLVNVLDYEMTLAEAVKAPKLIHRGEGVEMEPALFENKKIVQKFRSLGHNVIRREPFGNAQAIFFQGSDPSGVRPYRWVGASDPRGEGRAKGY